MKSRALPSLLCCLFVAGIGSAQNSTADKPNGLTERWTTLLDASKIEEAKTLCKGWAATGDLEKRIEAEKCLANVDLANGSHLAIDGNEAGGGTLGTGYSNEAIDAALVHLNNGIKLAPQDITFHEGRLHVLEVGHRYDAMLAALDESATIYQGPHTPDVWLAYAAELANYGEPTAGLKLCELLDKHYPNNSDILGNIGAFHSMLKQWDQALPYVRKAVAMHPTDPLDTWNLGWTLNHLNENAEASTWLKKSIDMGQAQEGGVSLGERKCLYGQFLVQKLQKKVEGCALVKANCEPDDRKVCVASPKAAPKK